MCTFRPVIEELPHPDAEAAFVTFSRLPHCLFLDSALRHPPLGRFSFLAADPFDYFEMPVSEDDALGTPLFTCLLVYLSTNHLYGATHVSN